MREKSGPNDNLSNAAAREDDAHPWMCGRTVYRIRAVFMTSVSVTEVPLMLAVTAGRELVQHLPLGHEPRLLDLIERARGMEQGSDAAPIRVPVQGRRGGRAVRLRSVRWHESAQLMRDIVQLPCFSCPSTGNLGNILAI